MLKAFLLFAIAFSPVTLFAQTTNNLAPGAPGKDAQWESAGKEGVGTSTTLESKVWFTLRDGVLTEVYYPTVDVANVRMLQFVVVNVRTEKVETERDDANHEIKVLRNDSLSFQQINRAKSGAWKIVKTYTTDPERSTVLIDLSFKPINGNLNDYQLYVYYDPSLNNTGMHDTAWTEGNALLAEDGDKASALRVSGPYFFSTNGFLGTSDGLTELKKGELSELGGLKKFIYGNSYIEKYGKAENGNVVQFAGFSVPTIDFPMNHYVFALGFSKTPDEALRTATVSLDKGFEKCQAEYDKEWSDYVGIIRRVEPKYQKQFNMAAMVLKAHEDKTYRGAMVASLTVPWGGGENANERGGGGYHTVWARGLYQVATAFAAIGDKAAARRALNYLFTVQQKEDGSFPQNSWLDGRASGGGLQMDEVAYPLILAYQLGRTDRESWAKHIKPAADFLVRKGPQTQQERWEEEAGYSPSTIAAEIAGLVCAAEIARRHRDQASAKLYLATADDWARKVDGWTATTSGVYGDRNYYIRITENDNPNDGSPLEINSNGGTYDERAIVDAGFLELVRLGIKSARDPLILKSLAVVDKVIKVETPQGAAWYRYNHDAYGERDDGGRYDARRGRGRLWSLLTGERGEYELARGRKRLARGRLDAMMSFANGGGMIPEQVWDRLESPQPEFRFGQGTGSATPLAWAMAQFIRLVVNLQEGKNLDTPRIVSSRYLARRARLVNH